MVQAVVEEVEVQDVLSRHPAGQQLANALVHEGGLAASPWTDAHGRLAGQRSHHQAMRGSGCRLQFLEIQDDFLQRVGHGAISALSVSGLTYNWTLVLPDK
ncbi:MAG: hypothetical protein OXC08_16105 [Thiotrichales bacterium]|nr:hypothetical protein [Thiotrichales bacterium]